MIVLDTNVVSEPLKPQPNPVVLDWLNAQAPQTLYLTSITVAELLAGVDAMPTGQKRDKLRLAILEQILPLFEGRVLPFDLAAAQAFAPVNTQARLSGHPIGFADGAIAAISAAHGFILATRNVNDFKGANIALINPWDTAR